MGYTLKIIGTSGDVVTEINSTGILYLRGDGTSPQNLDWRLNTSGSFTVLERYFNSKWNNMGQWGASFETDIIRLLDKGSNVAISYFDDIEERRVNIWVPWTSAELGQAFGDFDTPLSLDALKGEHYMGYLNSFTDHTIFGGNSILLGPGLYTGNFTFTGMPTPVGRLHEVTVTCISNTTVRWRVFKVENLLKPVYETYSDEHILAFGGLLLEDRVTGATSGTITRHIQGSLILEEGQEYHVEMEIFTGGMYGEAAHPTIGLNVGNIINEKIASESWVGAQLIGLASQSWVQAQISGVAFESWVNTQLVGLASQTWVNSQIAGISTGGGTNYIYAYSNVTQKLLLTTSWEKILFPLTGTVNGWVKTNSTFICPANGVYRVYLDVPIYCDDDSRGVGVRALKNGVEIPGSHAAWDIRDKNATDGTSNSFMVALLAGDIITFQATTGGGNKTYINGNQKVGAAAPSTNVSCSVEITKV